MGRNLISNRYRILRNDTEGTHETLINAIEQGILAVQPNNLIKKSIQLEDKYTLKIEGRCIDLIRYPKIFVLAVGKAAGQMASATEKVLTPNGSSKSLVTEGLAIVPRGIKEKTKTQIIEVHESDHPTPTQRGVIGAEKAVKLMERADESTLVIALISGGASSLMPLPHKGIELEDKIEMNGLLLGAGAQISEINIVRKHLSAIKGGRLITHLRGGLTVALYLSDVVGDDIGSIGSGPTQYDKSTYLDAKNVLKKYDLLRQSPEKVIKLIQRGIERTARETPKENDPIFNKVANFLIGNNKLACMAAISMIKAQEKERQVYYIGSELVGDVKVEGIGFARMVLNFQRMGRKIALVGGGERTVVLGKNPGFGGRNQQEALIAMTIFKDNPKIVGAYVGTDGIDGKSNAAGALLDARIFESIEDRIERHISKNDSNTLLESVDATIITGPTNTNVYDLKALLIN